MIRPAILVFFLGFILSGVFSRVWERGIELPPIQMAQRQFARLPVDLLQFPSACVFGGSKSSVQERRCGERWAALSLRALSAALPFLMVFGFLRVGYRVVRGAYDEADQKLKEGRVSFLGVVTEPAIVPNDLYGWFHGLNTISVQLKNGRQMNVYVPAQAGIPKPGEKLAIAPLGKKFGEKRAIGVVFIPHVSVVSGRR